MIDTIIIAILPVCGVPVNTYFYTPSENSVTIADLSTPSHEELSLKILKKNPHLEIDLAYMIDLNCS